MGPPHLVMLRVLQVVLRLPLVFLHQVEAVVAQLVTHIKVRTVGQVVVMLVAVALLVDQGTLADILQLRVMRVVERKMMVMAAVAEEARVVSAVTQMPHLMVMVVLVV